MQQHSPTMADNTHAPSRSQLSQSSDDDNSSGHSPGSFATLSGGSSGGLTGYPTTLSNNRPPPPPSSAATAVFCIIPREPMPDQAQQGLITPSSKRPRGRPPGSKNRPKPPVIIKQETEDAFKPVMFEIAAGNDVVETIIAFARRRRVGITVLSGTGSVCDVTLRHPVSRAPAFPIHGPFNLLSLNGTYIGGRFPSLLNSNVPPALPPCSSFGICLAGTQGQIFGGVVGGKVTAATEVVVMATVFKKPEFHRFPFIIENAADEVDEDDDDGDIYATVFNAADHRSGVVNNFHGPINHNVNIAMIPNMPAAFGVAANSTQMNGHVPVAEMNNVLQWNNLNNLP